MYHIRMVWRIIVATATIGALLWVGAILKGDLLPGKFYWFVCLVGGALAGTGVKIGAMRSRGVSFVLAILACIACLHVMVTPGEVTRSVGIVGTVSFLVAFLICSRGTRRKAPRKSKITEGAPAPPIYLKTIHTVLGLSIVEANSGCGLRRLVMEPD